MERKIIPGEKNFTISNRKVKVFTCQTCGREHGYYKHEGLAKRQAMTCHGNDFPCCKAGCAGRSSYHGGACQGCEDMNRAERWERYPIREHKADVDPFPLTTTHGDEYWFDEDEFLNHCVEHVVLPSEMLLVHANPTTSRTFDIREFLEDDLPDDDSDLPLSHKRIQEINELVNAAIQECGTLSYRPSSERPHPDLVKKWEEEVLLADAQLSGTDDEPAVGG